MTTEETKQDQKDVQESGLEKDEADFEELLLRRNAKEKFDNSKWSEIQVKDVQVYSGYEFIRSDNNTASGGTVRGTICGDKPPYDVLKDMNYNNYSEYNVEGASFEDYDGTIMYGNDKFLYRNRKWVIVTVESIDGTYENEYVITRTPKFEQDTIEDVYKSIISDINKNGSIGNPPDSNSQYLRTDQIINSTSSDMIFRSIVRLGVMGSSVLTGFFGGLLLAVVTNSIMIGSIFMFSLVLLASNMQQKIYDGWYEIAELNWIDDIPEEARITDKFTESIDIDGNEILDKYTFMNTDAEVKSFEDGTVVVDAGTNKWTLEGEDGLPSDKALEMYESYGAVDLSELGDVPIKIAEYDEKYPLTDNLILSDDGERVMCYKTL